LRQRDPEHAGNPREKSERQRWTRTLEVRVFRHFCGESLNFNPAVVVFRDYREPLVFRFYYAFHEAKVGRTRYLEELENRMFEALALTSQ
jgi:hypothetical protein